VAEKKLMVVIGAKASEFNRVMGQVKKDTRDISRSFMDVGRDLQTAGKSMTASITLPILAVGGAALKAYGDFEQTMTQSTAIMGTLSEDMRKQMEAAAREVGKTTKFGASEAAEAFEFLALAGLSAEQSIAALPQVAAFAQAGNFNLARATDLATDAQAALGITSSDAQENLKQLTRVTDVLTRAATLANANTEQFSESLTEKAGVALRNVKKDIEEGAAVLAVFADQGVKGGQAGTTLNATLEGLTRQAIKNKDLFKSYNVEVFDANGQMKNMADIAGDLEKALGGMSTEEQRATLLKMGFNRQALNGIQMLMGNSEAIREYEAELRNAGGVTQDVAEKQMNNLWDQLGLIKDRLVDSGIVIGEVLGDTMRDTVLPMIDRLVEKVAGLAEKFANLSPGTQQFIIKALALAAALGPLLMVAGKMAFTFGQLIPIIGKAGAVIKLIGGGIGTLVTGLGGAGAAAGGAAAGFGALLGPVLGVVAAIAAVTAGAVLLVKYFKKDVIPEVDLFADHVEHSVDSVTGQMKSMTHTISDTTKEAVGAYVELDDKAQKSLLNLHLRSTEITGEIKDDMVGQYKEMNTQLVAGMEKRKEEEIDLLRQTLNETGALTAQEARKALKDAEEHWNERIKETEGYQEEISRIFDRAARERREITENEYDRILELQEEMKNESIRILSENEIEAEVILNRMKDRDGRVTAETMAEHIKEVNRGRDEAVAAAEDEYDRRVRAIIRLRDETKSITAAQADKMIEEAKRARDETIEEAEDMRLGVLDKMRRMNEDLDSQVNTTTGTILSNWEKLKRWWSGWKPETKKIEVQQPAVQQMGSLGRTPQYASGTSYHPGGAAIVGEVGPELVNLPRGSQVIPLSGGGLKSEVRHSGTITIKGVNDQGQLVGVVDAVIERLIAEVRA